MQEACWACTWQAQGQQDGGPGRMCMGKTAEEARGGKGSDSMCSEAGVGALSLGIPRRVRSEK